MNRRTILAGAAAGAASLAGCLTGPTTGGTESGTGTTDRTTQPPAECPTTQGLDVEWPREFDADAAESFVEAYEHAYYRDVVLEYEPESSLDAYELAGGASDPPRQAGDGWVVAYSGSGGIYRPTLSLAATRTDAPEGADVVPVGELEAEPAVVETLRTAAEAGEADHHVDSPGATVERHVELFASVSEDFDPLSGPGDEDTLYVDVDGVTVELVATATNFHGDYWWTARYYVTERVVRRTTEDGTDPRDGTLLECRSPE